MGREDGTLMYLCTLIYVTIGSTIILYKVLPAPCAFSPTQGLELIGTP